MELLIKILVMWLVAGIIFGVIWLLEYKPWRALKKWLLNCKPREEESNGFSVTMELIQSKKWQNLEKEILTQKMKILESSSQLKKAIMHKLIAVDAKCVACGAQDELYEMNENQMPQNIYCKNCGKIYNFCMAPEFGAWMTEG